MDDPNEILDPEEEFTDEPAVPDEPVTPQYATKEEITAVDSKIDRLLALMEAQNQPMEDYDDGVSATEKFKAEVAKNAENAAETKFAAMMAPFVLQSQFGVDVSQYIGKANPVDVLNNPGWMAAIKSAVEADKRPQVRAPRSEGQFLPEADGLSYEDASEFSQMAKALEARGIPGFTVKGLKEATTRKARNN